MIEQELNDKLRQIKQSFRLVMNGEASRSMREKGLEYNVNWGVGIPVLRQMASEYGKDYDLAIALWKENIRECKVLATMIMPPNEVSEELVGVWMEQTTSQDMAEIAAFYLYQHLDYAPVLAYKWMACDKDIYQICAYKILAHLFLKGQMPNERGADEFLDQVATALGSGNIGVRHSAMICLQRFIELGGKYCDMASNALKRFNLDIFGTECPANLDKKA